MHIKKTISAFAVVLATTLAVAQEETQSTDNATENASEAATETAAKPVAKAAARFAALPQCQSVEGAAEVLKPSAENWQLAEENKYYPLGSTFRTKAGGKLEVALGPESFLLIEGESSYCIRKEEYGAKTRTLEIMSGTLELNLPENLPEGVLWLSTAATKVKNPAGKSKYVYEATGGGEKVTVRCVTGTLGIEGRHFDIPAMRAADEVVIISNHDFLSTELKGTSGDYVVKLDQGLSAKTKVGDDGQVSQVAEKAASEWHLSPSTRIVINRSLPEIGSRMSVHTMAFDAAGEKKSECYFCEGRAEINSGELVVKEKVDSEDIAKAAAETTETSEDSETEEGSSDDKKENKSESSES